ncbi:DUF4336 domain-containing protein [Vitreimonas sp.]|uniref:DUF4336 domain-containing protein n=1 Tax=Vitreimonas sp. TaxID=3069702 RepID=UPI002EDB6113
MPSLEPFGKDIWIADGPVVESAGFAYPTRMAIMRLEDGALFLWSPIALTPELRAAIDVLGEVRFVVTPTCLHYVALPAWRAAYPNATLYAAPGSRTRAKHIAFDADLTDAPPSGWRGQIDQALMHGNAIATEAIFFHRASGTVLFADLLQNFPADWFKGWRSLVARFDRMIGTQAQVPQKFRLAFTNRRAARESLARIQAWPIEKVLMAHGTPITQNGAAFITRAFHWLIRDKA